MVNFWVRLLNSKSCKLSNIMDRLLLRLHTEQIHSSKWISKVKSILDNCGLSHIWIEQGSKMDKNYVGRRIDDIATPTWLRDNQCSNYQIFIQEKCLETYLLKMNFSDRTKVCQFRCGNHKQSFS